MIKGEQKGPLTLEQLPEAGVTPSTYVWHKGMDDWQKAGELPDICRFYRMRLAGIPMKNDEGATGDTAAPSDNSATDDAWQNAPIRFRRMLQKGGATPDFPNPFEVDPDTRPASTLVMAIICTLLCFPPTGFVAIFYSWKTRSLWEASQSGDLDAERRRTLRVEAHEASRLSRLWLGITVSLGFILMGFMMMRA